MSLVHVLLDWQAGTLGCATTEPTPQAVPLNMAWRVTCPTCQARTTAGPQKPRRPLLSYPPHGEAVLLTGLPPLVGCRNQPMTALESAYAAVLQGDGTVLRFWFEPFPLPLPGKITYCPDFLCVLWDGSLRIIEVKPRKKTGTTRIVPKFFDDAKIKWKQAVERYTRDGIAFYLAIGWREQGAYRWHVEEAV